MEMDGLLGGLLRGRGRSGRTGCVNEGMENEVGRDDLHWRAGGVASVVNMVSIPKGIK